MWQAQWRRVQGNLCQKHLFSHQLTHNMTKNCSLIYQSSKYIWKLQAQNMLCTQIVFCFCFDTQKNLCTQHSELVIFMYWTSNSMNNFLSYCGLVDTRISASEKDLPVKVVFYKNWQRFYVVFVPKGNLKLVFSIVFWLNYTLTRMTLLSWFANEFWISCDISFLAN